MAPAIIYVVLSLRQMPLTFLVLEPLGPSLLHTAFDVLCRLKKALAYSLEVHADTLLGLPGASKSRQNLSRPCPFPLIPKGPDFRGRAGEGLSLPSWDPPTPSAGHGPCLPISYGHSRASPGGRCGEGNQGLLAC